MMKLIGLMICLAMLSGCAQLQGLMKDVVPNNVTPFDGTTLLIEGIVTKDWKKAYEGIIVMQDFYVALFGAQTIAEEYSAECVTSLEIFFNDFEVGNMYVLRESPVVREIEKRSNLFSINAITIGPNVIHVGKGKVLNVPHEVTHRQQALEAGETYWVQYLPVILMFLKTGYEKSFFEQDAREQDALFVETFGNVCALPI